FRRVLFRSECGGEHFLRLEQVMQVRGRVVFAGVAIALRIERLKAPTLSRRLRIDAPTRRVHCAAACLARGGDAVKGVGARRDSREQIVWLRDAEQMPRTILG